MFLESGPGQQRHAVCGCKICDKYNIRRKVLQEAGGERDRGRQKNFRQKARKSPVLFDNNLSYDIIVDNAAFWKMTNME
ncbi:UNVERIFIED_ORG: hypothetical protein B5F06_08615 [Lacrimispora saccharolytica]|nr:hypothetical protein DW757_08635 [Clostridium sp. AM29-11AC]